MNKPLFGFTALLFSVIANAFGANALLVENGTPRAEIVIAEEPERSARLAAAELQTYVEKISGARLPIATAPSADVPVQIYVGQSAHAEKLGITDEGLKFGAYRVVSGDHWLALIGDDTDFVPREPWAKNNGDRSSGRLQAEWETIIGEPFGVPNGGMYKNRARLSGEIGKPDGVEAAKNESLEIWGYDERGSFNAVCGFLRSLGVRWYLPGEVGEVVPKMASIALPKIDEVTRPDFEVRRFNVRFGNASEDTMKWMMRLGVRDPYGLMVAHGMHTMTGTEAVRREHPTWFARYGGKLDNQSGKRLNHLCYSNAELFQATVRWARAQFEVYDYDTVSIMPPDAYISICQCELCEGKEIPEMGSRGKLSNHVWDFVNRVAKEVGKTHPDKKIICCAYGANTDPPTNIEKLEPNVQVVIVGGRRPRNNLPDQREAIRQLRAGWEAKTRNSLMIFENYPFTGRGFYLPAFVPKAIGESINATKGVSSGEDIWLSLGRDFDTVDIGFNHVQVYFTARMYWGGKEQDPSAMFNEYCRLFYGPAGSRMNAFFDYCEDHWQDMERDKEKVDTALELFAAAKSLASPDSVYGKRIGLVDTFLEALRSKASQLGKKRGPLPQLRTVREVTDVVMDGKLDDGYWVNCLSTSTGSLRELQTGRLPIYGTTVKTGWDRGNLYFGIRCEERPGEALNIATEKREDQSIWYGDLIEIQLATDSHSYYQIAVNPAGALVDLDRGADKSAWFRWESQAEVATHVADDHWTVEIRIPVTDDENDPLNQVIGRKPSSSLPWHFNICRQRIRENGSEHSAFSPTGTSGYHIPMKFAYLYDGGSYRFEVEPAVTDFVIASRAAAKLVTGRNYEDAISAWVALAEGEKATDFQKSDALHQASACARLLKDYGRADELAGRIPQESVRKTAQMENLLGNREWVAVMEQFGEEDFAQWPFWQKGAGAFARGMAFYRANAGERAEADLRIALEFTSDRRKRMNILQTMGFNREHVLKNDDAALETYRELCGSTYGTGSSEYYSAILGATRILTRRGEFAEALQVLDLVDAGKLSGTWGGSLLLARAETLAAAGKNEEALKVYRAVLETPKLQKNHRIAAEEAIGELLKNY